MKMFHWNDLDSCANYARGDAIVMAENEDSARIKLREALQAWMAENREWQWLHGDEEDRAELEAKIEVDVAKAPHMVTDDPTGIIVPGSR